MSSCSPISVTILTKNSEKYLEKVLEKASNFDEIAVLDTGSEDSTFEIIKNFPKVTLYKSPFLGFGPSHNLISSLAKHDWVLSLDSDEVLTDALIEEILQIKLHPSCVYSFPRNNFYRGKWIKGCGWYPDRVFRLYNRNETRFTDALVHESIITTNLQQVSLKAAVEHTPYENTEEFLKKMHLYTSLFAKDKKGKRRGTFAKAFTHGVFAFFKSYLLQRGALLGSQGFEISAYNGISSYYKYLVLRDLY